MSRSERRIRNNRIRRKHQRRKNILLSILTVCLVITLSFTANAFFSNAETGASDIEFKYYKSIMVESGDTLWSIAGEHMSSTTDKAVFINEIKQLNGLHDDTITAGSYLVIPYFSNDFVTASDIKSTSL